MKFEPTDYEDLKVVRDCASDLNSKISDLGRGKRIREALDRIIDEASKAAPLPEGMYVFVSSEGGRGGRQGVFVVGDSVYRWSTGRGRLGSVSELRDRLTPISTQSSSPTAYATDEVAIRLWAEINRRSRGETVLWENSSEGRKDYYRRLARAALGVGD